MAQIETTDKNKTQMAVIKEFVYEFKAKDRLPLDLNSKSQVFLVINDLETSIAIASLFVGEIDFDEEDITGYSVLQLITEGTQLKIDENTVLKITFIDKTSGKEFYISKIRRPLFYDDDIEISAERRLKYIDLLLTTSMIPVEAERDAQENERKKLEEEERVRIEAHEKANLEAHKAAQKAAIIGGEFWEGQREELIKQGLTEYAFEDYRLFYKKSEGDEPSEIGFFILSPGNYEFIELFEEEITEEREEYSFEDDKEDEFRVVFDKVEGKISVD